MKLTQHDKRKIYNGFNKLSDYLEKSHGIDKTKYKFGLVKPKMRKEIKKVTVCLFKYDGKHYFSKAILNNAEDKFYGPAGEKEALKRMYRFAKTNNILDKLEEVTISDIKNLVSGELTAFELLDSNQKLFFEMEK
jgi:hypothetical protein